MTFDQETPPPRTTTARSRELGAELRAVRRRAGVSAVEVARTLGWSAAKLSKLEKGWRGSSLWDIGVLLGACGADEVTRKRVRRLVGEENTGQFLRPHHVEGVDGLLSLITHERMAVSLTCYEPMTVPALLQSEDYAHALVALATRPPIATEPVVRRRMDRRAVLSGQHGESAEFFLHEVALRLWVGDRTTMYGQAEWLLHLATRPRITLRIVPTSAGNHPALGHACTILTFPDGVRPVAYAQTDTATVFAEDDTVLESHHAKHSALSALALDVPRSLDTLAGWANELSPPNENPAGFTRP